MMSRSTHFHYINIRVDGSLNKNHSPSGHIFCKQAAGGWKHCEWRSCRSHLHPLWGDTCPETEGAACFHGTRLYTTVGKYNTKKKKLFTCETHYRIIFFVQRNRFSLYLVVLLQNIVHLGHVLAGDDLDDVPLVVWSVETSSTAALSITGNWGPACQRVLPREKRTLKDFTLPGLH